MPGADGRARRLRIAAAVAAAVLSCRGPETPVQVQGTVISIGLAHPVAGADLIITWPPSMGGGGAEVKTNSQGRYAARRVVRGTRINCSGIALTVRARGFASAYNLYSDSTCGQGLLTIDFKLFPLPR